MSGAQGNSGAKRIPGRVRPWLVVMLACLPLCAGAASLGETIRDGDHAAAMAMINDGADVNAPLGDGSTPLHWAVYKVDSELVSTLLKRGANPNVHNLLGATPLSEAANLANAELVRLLLKAKADANGANDDGQTALLLAARNGSLEVAQLLVRAGANVNAREKWRGQTALMWAIGSNNVELVQFLVKHKADVEARSLVNDWGSQITSEPRAQYRPAGGLTPLLYATRGGCMACVQALVKARADINRPNPDGITPLMSAIDNLNFDVANYLLDQGADPHRFDWWGRTALYAAVDMRSYSNRFLLGAGNAPADSAAPPGVEAALKLVKRLLDMGVDPNIQLNFHRPGRGGNSGRFTDDLLTTGCTPLLRAALSFDREVIELLLQHGAIIDLPNVMGVTPFMAASGLGLSQRDTRGFYGPDAQDRSLETLEVLLKAGADVNARVIDTSGHSAIIARPSSMTNRQGQTAIYGAINWGWARVAKYLIDHGARLDLQDASGKTPIDALAGNAGGRDFRKNEEIEKLISKRE
jgi:uncharacterized protein